MKLVSVQNMKCAGCAGIQLERIGREEARREGEFQGDFYIDRIDGGR